MGETVLSWLFLGVSTTLLAAQLAGLYRALNAAVRAAGLVRTIGCRVAAEAVYVALGVVTLAFRDSFPVLGLIVFSATQTMWLANTVADVRLRPKEN